MDDKVGKVFNYVQEKILNGEWDMGDKITPEIPLSKQLGVSRSVVREAIKKFVALNMLTRTQGGGTYVNNLTPNVYFNDIMPNISLETDGFLEILEVRQALDPLTVGLAMKENGKVLAEELRPILENMKKFKDVSKEFYDWDMRFHSKIAEHSENELIVRLYEIMSHLIKVHGRKNAYTTLDNSERLEEHEKILKAIEERDRETAKIYAGRHVENSMKVVQGRLKAF
ncbi:MAG: FadR family transcriptional regulator [Sebaldella sp.]|nr:FadR family transcriptional regulator [Sebaldella sp.]